MDTKDAFFAVYSMDPLRGHWLCKEVNLNGAIWSPGIPTTRVWCWNLSTCGNHCLLIFALWEQAATGWILDILDTSDYIIYQTNSFIILLVRQSVFNFSCLPGLPAGNDLRSPETKLSPAWYKKFVNGSLAKKGGLSTKKISWRCRSMYSHDNGNPWLATGKHTGWSQINTIIHLKSPLKLTVNSTDAGAPQFG